MQVMSADPLIFPRRFAVGLLLTRYDVSFDIAYRDQHRWTLEVILKPQRLTLHRLGVRHVHRACQGFEPNCLYGLCTEPPINQLIEIAIRKLTFTKLTSIAMAHMADGIMGVPAVVV